MPRILAAMATGVIAFMGLLTWEIVALGTAALALVVACAALIRSGVRDDEVAAWKAGQLARAQHQGDAIADDLTGD